MRDKAATGGRRFDSCVVIQTNGTRSPVSEAPSAEFNSCAKDVASTCNNSFQEHSAQPFSSEALPVALTDFSSRTLLRDDEPFATTLEEDLPEKLMKPRGGKGEHSVAPSLFIVDPEEETATFSTETTPKPEKELNTPLPEAEDKRIEDNHRSVALAASSKTSQDSGLVVEEEKSEKEHTSFAPKEASSDNETTPLSSENTSELVSPKKQETPIQTKQIETLIGPTSGMPHQEERYTKPMVEVSNEHENEFYDVLPTIRPSTYNPMAATCYTPTTASSTDVGLMSTFASLKKSIPMVQTPAGILNDAIAEASDEETSFDDHDNTRDISGDTLRGIEALDVSQKESSDGMDDVNFDFSRMEPQLAGDAGWKKMWPSCVDVSALPPIRFPFDWEQRQTLAAGVTHTWIQRQLQQELQGIYVKAGAYSEFAASLSDCPALTSGFLASDNSISFCFCPCSDQMEAWSVERLAETEEILYDGMEKCESQQLSPRGLVEHCRSTSNASGDLESRFLHGIIHKYLESVIGPSHEALRTQAVERNDTAAEKDTPDSISTPKTAPKNSNGVNGAIGYLLEGEELFQKLELAHNSRRQLEANTEASDCTAGHEEELTKLQEQVIKLEAVNTQLKYNVKLAEDSRLKLETKNREASVTLAEHKEQLHELQEMVKEVENINTELLRKLGISEEAKKELMEKNGAALVAIEEHKEHLKCLFSDKQALEVSNRSLREKLRVAEYSGTMHEAKSIANLAYATKTTEELQALKFVKSELQEELSRATTVMKGLEAKATESSATLEMLGEDIKKIGENNAELTGKLQKAEEKHSVGVASSKAKAKMMKGLCEELRQLEEVNVELKKKFKAPETSKTIEAKQVPAENSHIAATMGALGEVNQSMEDLAVADDREKTQASHKQNASIIHVGDMRVNLARFRVQCQKYFSKLRVTQLKSHCIRDKSSVNIVVEYDRKERNCIDIQKLLDKGAAMESQDATYLFRALDTFNKGHFHTHKLLLPWKIVTTDGVVVSRSDFFLQVWQQVGGLKVKVGGKKTEVPLFQETLGYLVPMPNAALESMLRVTPAELNRIFAAKIAPYYRALGRLMVQCIGATADDSADYNLKILGSFMPKILRQKLFRDVDPIDESYPLEQLLDHAFSLLGMDMCRDKAFEYFSIEAEGYNGTQSAVMRVRKEIQEMWIKERSLALEAISEGLSLNGLADMSFCCGLVPLEAISEVMFTE